MKILVDGKEAVLKAGSSFEYVSENPLFTEAEDYSMDIEFPMKDCPQNILIFGALHVKGVDISTVSFPCEIITESFDKTGILTITGVSNSEVKGQFLEGMSQNNYVAGIPNFLICDLDYSDYDGTAIGTGAAASVARLMGVGWKNMVVWNEEVERPYYNAVYPDDANGTIWVRNIYLYHLVELVGKAIGWKVDDTVLRTIPMYEKVVVANKREYLNNSKHRALGLFLPRWTIEKFMQEIANFFGCIYEIDSTNRKVIFKACSQVMSLSKKENISVIDDFEVEMTSENSSYRGSKEYTLNKECNDGNLNICSWIDEDDIGLRPFKRWGTPYANITELNTKIQNSINGNTPGIEPSNYLVKVTSIGKYVAELEHKEQYEGNILHHYPKLEILNQYGGGTSGDELGITPCNFIIAEAERGWYIEDAIYKMPKYKLPKDPEKENEYKSYVDVIAEGEQGIENFYFDKLYVVLTTQNGTKGSDLYTKRYEATGTEENIGGENYRYTTGFAEYPYVMSPFEDAKIKEYNELPPIDETKLYRYKFLSKTLPDPKAIYVIKGQEYACLRLTAHFTVDGMSELIEGEFYEIVG